MKIFWFLPTHGDGRYLGTSAGSRVVDFAYLQQVAGAADNLGYEGVLLPTGRSCEDAWIVASSLIGSTRRLKFLVAIRPGISSPGLSARMAASFDRLSHGRLLVNVVTGGDPEELEGDGLFADHKRRYAITAEFLTIWRETMTRAQEARPFDFDGVHLRARGSRLMFPALQRPHPPLYFGGSSSEALDLAAEQVDVYLTWGEPPAAVKDKLMDAQRRAAARGRQLRFGIRLHVIVRETNALAWDAARNLISKIDDDTIDRAQAAFAKTDSEGQRRMSNLHKGRRDQLEIAPNLWAGVGLVRGGAGTALVGDPDTVAARMQEYAELGIETFILSGYPHLEEAYRFAELVFPKLPLRLRNGVGQGINPTGEIMANALVPKVT